jgi:alpha-L-fucosidase
MQRREFLLSGLALAGAPALRSAASRRFPEREYERAGSYVEDNPVSGYHWASDRAYERFRDMKYGVRIHWGLYSIWGRNNESWPFLLMPFEERQRYQDLYRTWNPNGFDADEWTQLFADSGMKMFAFTSKHHEGFAMFDTKTRVRRRVNWTAPGGPRIEPCDLAYSIMETPFRRDVVGELCAAGRKRGLKIDLYFSPPDWYDADFRPYAYHPLQAPSSRQLDPGMLAKDRRIRETFVTVPEAGAEEVDHMMTRMGAQLTEILTKYGTIDMVCLDQWLGPAVWPRFREIVMQMRKLQPDVMLRDRGIVSYGDYYTPEGFVPGAKENTDMPWMTIRGLGSSFSYDKDPANYKGPEWVVSSVVDASAKGGGFMVGIGPDGNGRFHPTAIAQLKEAGRWFAVNGEAIYGTRPREGTLWQEGEKIRFTQSKDGRTVYAHSIGWPGETLALKTVEARPGSEIHLLGYAPALPWGMDPQRGLLVRLPADLQDPAKRPCQWVFSFRIAAGAA